MEAIKPHLHKLRIESNDDKESDSLPREDTAVYTLQGVQMMLRYSWGLGSLKVATVNGCTKEMGLGSAHSLQCDLE